MGWEGSTRAERLPSGWAHIRARILARDPVCRVCERRLSSEVDHITAGDDHSDTNLQGLCRQCHWHKSALEGAAARPRQRREPEPHPGVIEPEVS